MNHQNQSGNTALMIAANAAQLNIVRALLDAGRMHPLTVQELEFDITALLVH